MNKDTNIIPNQQVLKHKGYIPLSREILNSPHYLSEKFTKSAAWIDLLLLASFQSSTFCVRGISVQVGRGQLAWSQKSLAARWQWSKRKITRFLAGLKSAGQMDFQNSNVTTLITIHSFDNPQGMGMQTVPQKNTRSTPNGTHYKNVKKEKNIYGSPLDFYKHQLTLPDIHPEYEKFVAVLQGDNELHRPLERVMAIPEQLSADQFKRLVEKHRNKTPLAEILLLMENTPKYTQGKQSLFLVLNYWLSNNFKNKSDVR
jgi:hypothetical protein